MAARICSLLLKGCANMRSVKLARKLMAKHEYRTFLSLIRDDMGATIEAKTVEHGPNGIELVECCITFEASEYIMTRAQRDNFDADKHWQRILDLCAQLGLCPETESADIT
jgi:hypothetical protein